MKNPIETLDPLHELPVDALLRARKWRGEHWAHVGRLMKAAETQYSPSGSDLFKPELWKAAHWRWFAEVWPYE